MQDVKTNEDFLVGLFGTLDGIWVGAWDQMKGGFAQRELGRLNPNVSNYYAAARMVEGTKSRCDAAFKEGIVIVLDDVGTKMDRGFTETFAPRPTYIVETSPNNFQWGYVLAHGEQDAGRWATFQEGLKSSETWGPVGDGSGLGRYWRLPFGRAHKDKCKGFQTRLVHWDPKRWFTLDGLAQEFGIDMSVAVGVGAARVLGKVSQADAMEDPIFAALFEAGRVLGDAPGEGWFEVLCPWEGEHTNGGGGGSAYHPLGGYKCHHTHCADKGVGEVAEYLFEGDIGGYRSKVFPPLPDEEKDEALHRTVEKRDMVREIALLGELSRARKRLPDFEEFQGFKGDTLPRAHSVTVRPPRVLMGLQRDDVTLLAASPAAGKSLLSLQMALAVAHENPSIIGGKFVDWTGDVIIVSNEDSKDVILRRVEAVEKFFGLDPALRKHDIHVVTGPGITLLSKTGNQIKPSCLRLLQFMVERRRNADIALVVIDTFSSVMRGMNENDNQEMQQVMDFAKHISKSAFSSLMLVHHLSKAGSSSGNGANMDKARGASAIVGAIRSGLELGPVSEADASRYGWTDAEKSKWVRLDSTKSSYEAKTGGEALTYYKWHTLTVPTRDARDGQIHDLGVGVLKPETPPPFTQNTTLMRGYLDKIQEALDMGEEITLSGKTEMKGAYRAVWDVLGMSVKKGKAVFAELESAGLVRKKKAWSAASNEVSVVDIVAHDDIQDETTV